MRHLRIARDPEDAPPPPVSRSVQVKVAAAMMDCDPTTVRKLLKDGLLAGHKIGTRGVRIYLASIRDYQNSTEIEPKKTRAAAPRRSAAKPTASHFEAMAFLRELGCVD
jgi:hypothetical protein